MATDKVTFRISGMADFRAEATKEVITTNTTLLDVFKIDASGGVMLHGWSPKTIDFWMKILNYEDIELEEIFDELEAEVKDVWSIASFHEKFIRSAQLGDDDHEHEPRFPTVRLRQWFRQWWEENDENFRGNTASDLTSLVIPAFYIGDARAFMSITHSCFLHTNNQQASLGNARMPMASDEGGRDEIDTHHPLLGKLAAARSNMINKIEDALPYDEERDGLPRGRGFKSTVCEDPDCCPMLKSAAYYKALKATACWPVGPVMKNHSIHQVLTMLANKFNYVNYDNMQDMPDRAAARARMPADREGQSQKRCKVCVDAAVKASFNKKVRSLIRTLLDEKKTTVTVVRGGRPVAVQVDDSFAGLCLDCLTKTKFGSEDADYWNHCLDFEFDHGCTVPHGQPTWYFSYLGRAEDMKWYTKEKAKRQAQRRAGR